MSKKLEFATRLNDILLYTSSSFLIVEVLTIFYGSSFNYAYAASGLLRFLSSISDLTLVLFLISLGVQIYFRMKGFFNLRWHLVFIVFLTSMTLWAIALPLTMISFYLAIMPFSGIAVMLLRINKAKKRRTYWGAYTTGFLTALSIFTIIISF